jgi:hypothetical protein
MPAGIPGRVSRRNGVTLEPVQLGGGMLFGAPGKIVNGKLVPLAGGDAVGVIYGFLASQYPTQSDMADLGGGSAAEGTLQSVMRRGYMTARIIGGAPAKGAPVYVVTATSAGAVGSLSASSGTGLAAIPGCTFMGDADGDGNVEISFNI